VPPVARMIDIPSSLLLRQASGRRSRRQEADVEGSVDGVEPWKSGSAARRCAAAACWSGSGAAGMVQLSGESPPTASDSVRVPSEMRSNLRVDPVLRAGKPPISVHSPSSDSQKSDAREVRLDALQDQTVSTVVFLCFCRVMQRFPGRRSAPVGKRCGRSTNRASERKFSHTTTNPCSSGQRAARL